MLKDHLDTLGAANLAVTETPSHVKVRWAIQDKFEHGVQSCLRAVSFIAARDSYELLLDAGEERLSVSREAWPDSAKIRAIVDAASYIDQIDASLQIEKPVSNGRSSVYFLDRLGAYFEAADLQSAVDTLAGMFVDHLQFEVFDKLQPFGTETITFSGPGAPAQGKHVAARSERLETFKGNCHSTGLPAGLLPSDFYLSTRSGLPAFDQFFDTAAAVLSLSFLANTSELRSTSRFSFKIYGYKAVLCKEVEASSFAPAVKTVHEIFAWAYEGGSAADKLGLVRNVVSLHLDAGGRPVFDSYVQDAIHSNYQIYLKGNIQSYLEVKNKLADLLLDSVERTGRLADDVLDSFKNNAFVVITFLLTVVVINGLKDTSFASIFSGAYVFLVLFLAASSVLWMVLIRRDAFSRYASASKSIETLLRTNYEPVLMKAEIDASLHPTLARNEDALRNRIRNYTRWWGVLLALFVCFFMVGNYLFVPATQSAGASGASSNSGKPVESPAGVNASMGNKATPPATQAVTAAKQASASREAASAGTAPTAQMAYPTASPKGKDVRGGAGRDQKD